MAQPIHCDGQDHRDALADVLVTRLENGDVSAWCEDHFLQFCVAVVDLAVGAETAITAQAAESRLESAGPPPRDPGDDPDDEPEAAPSPPAGPPDLGVSTFRPEGDQPDQAGLGGPETGPGAEGASEPTPELIGAPGPTGGLSDDPGGAPPTE